MSCRIIVYALCIRITCKIFQALHKCYKSILLTGVLAFLHYTYIIQDHLQPLENYASKSTKCPHTNNVSIYYHYNHMIIQDVVLCIMNKDKEGTFCCSSTLCSQCYSQAMYTVSKNGLTELHTFTFLFVIECIE